MKNLTDILKENLDGQFFYKSGFGDNDTITRSYNNLYGNMSNTHLHVLTGHTGAYVLTGSKIREGADFLFARDIAVNGKTAAEWFDNMGLSVMSNTGEVLIGDDLEEENFDLLTAASQDVKDNDYMVVYIAYERS